ncbi:GNAT family N-acetyltransferase [Sagittula sp. SSi028]|uniref:GNAT family N-acetyltransferase n=1 Tax=Sagittula sp. SSi028 TaxID=3400636 RepID=UPI003AF83DCD
MSVSRLTGADLQAALPDLAALRIEVFRAFPYLYDGDLSYEKGYLTPYRDNPRAVLVAARQDGRIVGAATGMPLADHGDAAQMTGDLPPINEIFYCAESVLLEPYRGQGFGHAFFDLREAQARELGFRYSLFCAVQRPADHPARPVGYRPLDGFWRKRGYAPAEGVTATFHWTDVGGTGETPHSLQAWIKQL